MRTILHHFQYTTEPSLGISHGKIDDVDEHSWLVDPEFSLTLFATTELFNDLFYDVYALTGVTILHFSADNVLRTREDTMVSIGIELHQLILINERNVDRQVLIDEVYLLQCELSRCHIQLLLWSSSVSVLAEKCLKISCKTVC